MRVEFGLPPPRTTLVVPGHGMGGSRGMVLLALCLCYVLWRSLTAAKADRRMPARAYLSALPVFRCTPSYILHIYINVMVASCAVPEIFNE
jgi:hypothetical protein